MDIPTRQIASGSGERQKPKSKPREEKADDEEVEATVSFIKQSVSLTEERLSKKTRIRSDSIKRKVRVQAEEEKEEAEQLYARPAIEEPAEIPGEEPKISHKATLSDWRTYLPPFLSWAVLTQYPAVLKSPANTEQEIPLVSEPSAST